MVINTNTSAASSARLLTDSQNMLTKSLARLSSGSKITSPEDDVAGMAVSLKFDAQLNRLNATRNNVGNATSFTQTQDGFLNKVGKALDRMSELSVLAQDVTKSTDDLALYDKEFQTLGSYISDVAGKDFNGISLFGGTNLQVTTDSDANKFSMTGVNLGGTSYTTATGSAVTTSTAAANRPSVSWRRTARRSAPTCHG